MHPEDLLAVSAEISIAILGFAAIASVFRGSQSSLTPDGRFWGMLALAFIGLASSLVPLPFLVAEVSRSTIWGIASIFLSLSMLSLTIMTVVSVRGANLRAGVSTNLAVMIIFTTAMGSTAVLAFSNSGLFSPPTFSVYFGAVVAVHLVTVAVFRQTTH